MRGRTQTPLPPTPGPGGACYEGGPLMSKRGRKRKDRRKNAANHGKRPNA
ncbi:Uncharacterised protein [Mycobacteroides abscessus subsp. abscessus]|nr:Uncharacterised protein [Mycobacteroides abscessus subsp. abscessus]